MSGTDGLFCGGLELLTWLLPSPFDRLLLFTWLPRGFNDDVEEEDELFDWYEGFNRLSLSGGVSRRVGGTMGVRLCFTFTFLPISVWFGFISLVLHNITTSILPHLLFLIWNFSPFVFVIFLGYRHAMSGGFVDIIVSVYPHFIRDGTEYTEGIARHTSLMDAFETATGTLHVRSAGQGEFECRRVIGGWQW